MGDRLQPLGGDYAPTGDTHPIEVLVHLIQCSLDLLLSARPATMHGQIQIVVFTISGWQNLLPEPARLFWIVRD